MATTEPTTARPAPIDDTDPHTLPWRLNQRLIIGIITRSAAAAAGHDRPDESDMVDALDRLDAALPGGLDYMTHRRAMIWIYEPDTF